MIKRLNDRLNMTPGALYGLVVVALTFTVILCISIWYTAHQYRRVTNIARSQCESNMVLGSFPIALHPQTPPTKVIVRIIVAQRDAWIAASCPGHLPPPSAGLEYWAGKYRVIIRG